MKAKRTLLLALVLLSAVASHAQARFGVRAGAGYNKVSPFDLGTGDYSFKSILCPTIGAMVTYSANEILDFQAELNYTMRGFKDDVFFDDGISTFKGSYKVRSSYLEVPLLAKVFPIRTLELNLQAGPQVGFLLGRSISPSDKAIPTDELKTDNQPLDAAFVIGLGYDNGRISVDTRYTLGLVKTYKHWQGYKNRGLSITAGYYF